MRRLCLGKRRLPAFVAIRKFHRAARALLQQNLYCILTSIKTQRRIFGQLLKFQPPRADRDFL
jgi:hypothetical protein